MKLVIMNLALPPGRMNKEKGSVYTGWEKGPALRKIAPAHLLGGRRFPVPTKISLTGCCDWSASTRLAARLVKISSQ